MSISIIKKIIPLHVLFVGFQIYLFAQNDWENPQITTKNTQKPRATFVHYDNIYEARNAQSSKSKFYQSLNGHWKFHFSENIRSAPTEFHTTSAKIEDWKNMIVPSNWELHGYDTASFLYHTPPFKLDPPHIPASMNSVGAYRRTFTIPNSWKNRRTFIHFDAVRSAMYIWINGQKVGYSQNNDTPTEFEITKYLRNDNQPNILAVQVFKYSDGSFLDTKNRWQFSGITGNVFLFSTPNVRIRDFYAYARSEIRTNNGILNLNIKIEDLSQKGGEYTIQNLIYDANDELIDTLQATSEIFKKQETVLSLRKYTPKVKLWSDETPHLYRLVIVLKKKDKIVDIVSSKIGYRTISLNNGSLSVNQKKVLLKGVNYYIHDPKTGNVMSEKSMIEDIRIMKRNHINAVRLVGGSHPSRWYELCDKYGIYVVDEAHLNTQISPEPNQTLANQSTWKKTYLERIQNMMERDKNHPSVIFWSMGDHAGFGQNYKDIYKTLKQSPFDRFLIYDHAERSHFTDAVFPDSPSMEYLEEFFRTTNRPLFIGQWRPTKGTALGGLQDFWEFGRKHQYFGGIFIDGWAERALRTSHEKEKKYLTTGTTHGNDTIMHDAQESLNGILFADKTSKVALKNVRKLFQPTDFKLVDGKQGVIEITNHFKEDNLSTYQLTWDILENGQPMRNVKSYNDPHTYITQPGQSQKVSLRRFTELFKPKPNHEYALNVQLEVMKPNEIFKYRTHIAEEQFILSEPVIASRQIQNTSTISMRNLAHKVAISTQNMLVEIDKKTGAISNLKLDDQSFLQDGNVLNFWRPSTINDTENTPNERRWDAFHPQNIKTKITEVQAEKLEADVGRVSISGEISNPKNHILIEFQQVYTVHGTGDIILNTKYLPHSSVKNFARIGYQFKLNKEFQNLEWYGLGAHPTYTDRNCAARMARYSKNIKKSFEHQIMTRESANQSNVRWAVISNRKFGLYVQGHHFPIQVSAHPFDPLQIAQQIHHKELTEANHTTFNVDYQMAGLGHLHRYKIPAKVTEFTLRIKPFKHEKTESSGLKKKVNPQDFAYEKLTHYPTEFLPPPNYVASEEVFNKPTNITLHCSDKKAKIRYTLDGDEPSKKSKLYKGETIELRKSTTLKMRSFKKKSIGSYIVKHKFHFINAERIDYVHYPDEDGNRPFILMDGKFGNPLDTKDGWQGFAKKNAQITIKLAKAGALKKLRFRFLVNQKLKAFAPTKLIMEVSEDGKVFEKVYDYVNNEPEKLTDDVFIKEFTEEIDVKSKNIKYIRLNAEQLGTCPNKHPNAGERTWLFLDEIFVSLKNENH